MKRDRRVVPRLPVYTLILECVARDPANFFSFHVTFLTPILSSGTGYSVSIRNKLVSSVDVWRVRDQRRSLVEGLAMRLRDPRSGWTYESGVDVGAEAPTYLRSTYKDLALKVGLSRSASR